MSDHRVVLRRAQTAAALLLLAAAPAHAQRAPQSVVSDPFYPANLDAPLLARLVDDHLAAARAAVERLVAVSGERTAANTLQPFDDARNHETMAQGLANIAIHLHPDSALRAAGLKAEERTSGLRADIAADPRIARALEALDTIGLTAEERLLAARLRRDYRRAGADRDEATRARLRANFETLDRLATAFARNLAEDTTTIVATLEELTGLPPDWIAGRAGNPQGHVILTVKYPDFFPVIHYAASRALRRRAAVAYANRGWPANAVVLDSLLRVREMTAQLLGYPDWASYQSETRMAGSPDAIRAFLERVDDASATARARLVAQFLTRLREEDPSVTRLASFDRFHAGELIRREQFALDGREVRAYFPFALVKKGVLELAGELFGLEFRRADVPVWHPSVEAWEARENGRLIGRIYLDLHPRPGKFQHAAVASLRPGLTGRQLPEAVLAANFPGGAGEPDLMDHGGLQGVTTLLHEFGHLLHALFAVRPYVATGFPDEHDFIEAPSQMLEEWAWQPAFLRRITRHAETGAPIPDELVRRMQGANTFDAPLRTGMDLAFAAVSLLLHAGPAEEARPDSLMAWAFTRYLGVDVPAEAHGATSLDHLGIGEYSASYYTYLWSQVIAKDLWSAFAPERPLDPAPARRYRDAILRAGGSKPAAQLIEDFLGRPFGFTSWRQWLERRP